jgi:signal transduction histidine kinase
MTAPSLRQALRPSWSLTQFIQFGLVAIAVLTVLMVGGSLTVLSYQAHLDEAWQLQQARVQAAVGDIESHLNGLQYPFNYFSKVRGLSRIEPDVQRRFLEGLTRTNHAYEVVAIFDRQGEFRAGVAPYQAGDAERAFLISHRQMVRRVLNRSEQLLSPVTLDTDRQTLLVTIATPLYDASDQLDGVLLASVNLEGLNGIIAQTPVGRNGSIYIVDRRQRVLTKTRNVETAHRTGQLERLPNAIASRILHSDPSNRFKIYQGLQGQSVLGVTALVYSVGWYVVVELPVMEVYAPVWTLMTMMLWTGGGAIAIAIAVGLGITRRIVKPLHRLTHAAEAISDGDFQTRVQIDQTNELGTLATAFNVMMERMEAAFADLGTKNQELGNALQELKTTQLQLIQTEKMSSLGRLVAGIAHEINNPITFIHGNLLHAKFYATTLLELVHLYQTYYPEPHPVLANALLEAELDFIEQDFPQLIQSMQDGSKRVEAIVTSLRNFSRLDEAQLKVVDVHEGIENTLLLLQSKLQCNLDGPPIALHKDYGALPPVECYPALINQVLFNLLENAILALNPYCNAQSDRQPTITITTANELGDRDRETGSATPGVMIAIADNGVGIPPDVQSQMFDPFFTTRPIGQGTGLGLALSYKIIVEKHHGSIDCQSTPAQGSCFRLWLPIDHHPD